MRISVSSGIGGIPAADRVGLSGRGFQRSREGG